MSPWKKGNKKSKAQTESVRKARLREARARRRADLEAEHDEPSLAPEVEELARSRPRIAPLPSLPEPEPAQEAEEEKPTLRLAGERQLGSSLGDLMRQNHGSNAPARRVVRKRGIPMPEGHMPREILGDAAALFQWVKHDRADDVRRLIANGADPNLTDDPDNVHRDAVAFLCQNEDVGEESPEGIRFGRTACHLAAAGGHTEVLRALIEGGCNVNVVDHAGKPPLMRAARGGHLEAARLLVQAGAEVDLRDLRHSSALLRAADAGHADVVRFLLDSGAEIDARDCRGRTPLIAASAGVHAETVRQLLAAGADPHLRDAVGADALSAAVDAVEPEDPNSPSPFHVVREDRLLPVVSLLMDAGARDQPDEEGVWHSQRADERGHHDVANLLRRQSA